ncbi:hypothetical protein C0J52_03959 [Blattella germanica]|nr:hypothetical protein C0J52_03959 [Blattella germanica]
MTAEKVTLIGLYIKPLMLIEDIIATIWSVLKKSAKDTNIIIASDLNCRKDLQCHRSLELLQMMTEEGFELINEAEDWTYYSQ